MKLSTKLLLNTSLVGMMMFTGCMEDGDNGTTALIKTTAEAAGDNCTNGGTRIDIGLDDDVNGILESSEIDSTQYICNSVDGEDGVDGADGADGANGVDGLTTLTNTTAEPAGENCAEGGFRIDMGVDDDANGTLEASEIDSTEYICSGATGEIGEPGEDGLATLIRTSTLPQGDSHCFAGGTRLQVGVDDNDDGLLGSSEIDSTAYICNGLSAAQVEEKCLLDAGGYKAIDINYYVEGTYLTRTWLDRNLGASRIANADNDTAAFGNYYQWGRVADGHENNESDINNTLATTLDNNTNSDWYGKFIVTRTYPGDWVLAADNDGSLREQSWNTPYDETNNPNQVCPCGYVVPTMNDYDALTMYAEAEKLKMPKSGFRDTLNVDGNITLGEGNSYWTTTQDSPYVLGAGVGDDFYVGSPRSHHRGDGLPVRCIKPVQGIVIQNNPQ